MKKSFNYLILFVFTATLLISCSSDDDSVPPVNETPKSEAKQLTSFVFNANNNDALEEDVTAVINEADKTITVTVPYGTDIKVLQPTIEVSDKATVNPTGVQDFSSLVDYTVTAEDGTEAIYEVTVSIALNDEKQIISFVFEEDNNGALNESRIAEVNEEEKTITVIVPYNTKISALVPTIEVSEAATISPEGAQAFFSPVNYTVTAEDGTEEVYEVIVAIAAITERQVLIAIFNANPDNTLGWDVSNPDSDISTWNGVSVNENGYVVGLNLRRGREDDGYNIKILPEEIGDLINLTELNMSFNDFEVFSKEIYKLTNLTELIIINSSISEIPQGIGNLVNLTTLVFSTCKLTKISDEIFDLNNLTILGLGGNYLDEIPSEIGNLTNLTTLNLGNNGDLAEIPSEIGDLINLTWLDLRQNSLGALPDKIGSLSNLEILYVSENKLISIPEEIGNLENLTSLDIRYNLLTSIPQEVCDLENTGTVITRDAGVTCE